MKTIILEGIEYVLIPKDQYLVEHNSVEKPSVNEVPLEVNVLGDFLLPTPDPVVPPVVPIVQPLSNPLSNSAPDPTPQNDGPTIKIVKATSVGTVKVAQPRQYSYREKFNKRQLTTQDVVGHPTASRELINSFKDLEVFAADQQRPREKQLFYGPGIEIDSPNII